MTCEVGPVLFSVFDAFANMAGELVGLFSVFDAFANMAGELVGGVVVVALV